MTVKVLEVLQGEVSYQNFEMILKEKQAVRKELNRLQNKKPLGKEDLSNIPFFNGHESITRKALRGLSNCLAVRAEGEVSFSYNCLTRSLHQVQIYVQLKS